MKNGFKHLTRAQRIELKKMLDSGDKKAAIASALGVCRGTVYNEIKRGTINGRYEPDYSEKRYRQFLSEKGRDPILSLNSELADYIATLILKEHKSPEQIMNQLQSDDKFKSIFSSVNTLYNAIDRGLIPEVTRESLNPKTTTVFSDGTLHIAKWIKDSLDIKDGDVLHIEVKNNKLIFTKVNET